jgi:phosphate uptake regulator
MEMRKIQVTGGGSSYIITLPIEWVRFQELDKNDPVGVIQQPDGTLLITAKKPGEQRSKVKVYDISNIGDADYLFRLLIGAYIMGFSKIELTSKNRIDANLKSAIQKFSQSAMGFEIMEETATSATIKAYMDPQAMPLDTNISRMYLKVNEMHEDAIRALNESDTLLANETVKSDSVVDRLHWLIARQTNLIMRDTILAKNMEINPEQAVNYLIISRILERIGDHAVKIAENVPIKGLNQVFLEKLVKASNLSLSILAQSMDAWTKRDIKNANAAIKMLKDLVSAYEEIHDETVQLEGEPTIAVSYILESIRRTGEYAVDISEVTINLLVNV